MKDVANCQKKMPTTFKQPQPICFTVNVKLRNNTVHKRVLALRLRIHRM